MRARVLALLGLASVVLVGCAPTTAAPIGGADDRVCRWVQESVRNGSMPVDMAYGWYGHCGPFGGTP